MDTAVQGRPGDAREDPGSARTKSGTPGSISPATASSCLDVSPWALPALTSGINMAQHQDPDQQHCSRLVKVEVGLLKQLDIKKYLRGF